MFRFVNLHRLSEVFSNKRLSTISSFPIQLLFSTSSNLILDDHFTCFLPVKFYLRAFDKHVVCFFSTAGALVVITFHGVIHSHPTFCSAAHQLFPIAFYLPLTNVQGVFFYWFVLKNDLVSDYMLISSKKCQNSLRVWQLVIFRAD